MDLSIVGIELINFFMIAAGIGVSCLSIVQIIKSPIEKKIRKVFILFLCFLIIYLSMYLVRMLLIGHPGPVIRYTILTALFIEFSASGLMTFMLTRMIMHSAISSDKASDNSAQDDITAKKSVWLKNIARLLLALHFALLDVAQVDDLYYFLDEANVYHRSDFYIISNIAPTSMMILGIYLMIRYRSKFEKKIALAYWTYLLAPMAAVLIQAFYSDIKFIIIATVGAAIYMFMVITTHLTAKYEEQQMESSRMETELSMATRIQSDMLPTIFPAFPEKEEFDIFASMFPAKEVGGDFYDFFLIDDDHLGLVMADVSGKGVPAALFMMASKILIQNYTMTNKSPKAALESANFQICQNNRERMFVTVWLGILDLQTGILTASNAGHEYPVLKNPDGPFEIVKDKHGFVIGGSTRVKYTEYELKMEKGSMLFLYTDGVPEANNADEELFGLERTVDALNLTKENKPEAVLDSVRNAVSDFVKDAPQFDDLTMLCLRYNGPQKTPGKTGVKGN